MNLNEMAAVRSMDGTLFPSMEVAVLNYKRAGKTNSQISELLNKSMASVASVVSVAKRNNTYVEPEARSTNKQAVIALKKEGYSNSEVANMIGATVASVASMVSVAIRNNEYSQDQYNTVAKGTFNHRGRNVTHGNNVQTPTPVIAPVVTPAQVNVAQAAVEAPVEYVQVEPAPVRFVGLSAEDSVTIENLIKNFVLNGGLGRAFPAISNHVDEVEFNRHPGTGKVIGFDFQNRNYGEWEHNEYDRDHDNEDEGWREDDDNMIPTRDTIQNVKTKLRAILEGLLNTFTDINLLNRMSAAQLKFKPTYTTGEKNWLYWSIELKYIVR